MTGLRERYARFCEMNQDCGGFSNRILNVSDFFLHYYHTKKMLDNHKKKNLKTNHAGIIVVLWDNRGNEDIMTISGGIDLLVDYFDNKKKELYDIYICKTKEDVIDVIEKIEVNRIWIFGHGWMGGLYFGSFDNKLEYSYFKSLKEEQKKDFIGQFHCNSDGDLDSSLAAYILKFDGKKFIKKGYRCSHQNRLAIKCCNEKNWDCNDSC
jgi:hypothetical protein